MEETLLKEAAFDYSTDIVSKKQFSEHLKLYKGYISKFNLITEKLAANADRANSNPAYSKYRALKKGETFTLDAALLHELYFQNLGYKSDGCLAQTKKLFDSRFGGEENFFADLTAAAMASRGWVVFSYDQRSRSFRNFIQDSHDCGNIMMAFPLIVLDMYEHAYFMDFGTDKGEYVKRFKSGINWEIVEQRLKRLDASFMRTE